MVKICGIIGFYAKELNEEQKKLLRSLLFETKIRGLHAFGYSFQEGDEIKTEKSNRIILEFQFKNAMIFHNRYSTSGDYNVMENNQPITIRGFASLAMNGVLTMQTKKDFEKTFNVTCSSDNDTEIILRKMIEGMEIKDFLKIHPECSFAGVLLKNNEVYAIRNNKRPLYLFKKYGAVFVVSTRDIAKRAGVKEVETIKPYESVKLSERI